MQQWAKTKRSFHAKKYADLPRLQLNMGHRDQTLLRSRYVNMRGLSKSAANSFFGDSFSTLANAAIYSKEHNESRNNSNRIRNGFEQSRA